MAIHLALGGRLRGRRVLLADIDPQGSSSDALRQRRFCGPDVEVTTSQKLFVCLETARRRGIEDVIIDTAAGSDNDRLEAVRLADASLIIVRPTYLDIVAAAPAVEMIRRLGSSAMILVNQAPVLRNNLERPDLIRALKALKVFGLPVCSEAIRVRQAYQSAPLDGRSVEECDDHEAAREMARAYGEVCNFRQIDPASLALRGPAEDAWALAV